LKRGLTDVDCFVHLDLRKQAGEDLVRSPCCPEPLRMLSRSRVWSFRLGLSSSYRGGPVGDDNERKQRSRCLADGGRVLQPAWKGCAFQSNRLVAPWSDDFERSVIRLCLPVHLAPLVGRSECNIITLGGHGTPLSCEFGRRLLQRWQRMPVAAGEECCWFASLWRVEKIAYL